MGRGVAQFTATHTTRSEFSGAALGLGPRMGGGRGGSPPRINAALRNLETTGKLPALRAKYALVPK
jgi:hypothetical protein